MAARGRKTGLVSVEEVHPSPSTMSNLQAQKARSKNAMSANALIAPVDLFPSAVLPIIACCASANWAAGAMGVVCEAEGLRVGRQLALKFLSKSFRPGERHVRIPFI
jgi:hypothetical protein